MTKRMQYRRLGKTGIETSVIGLGTDYMQSASRETVVSVVGRALDQGLNYIDLLHAQPQFRNNFAAALRGRRDKVIITGHLGVALKDGQYFKSHDNKVCEKYFLDLLARVNTDYVDIMMVHYVDSQAEYEKTFPRLLEIVRRFQQEGKARFVGMSGHNLTTSLRAVESGTIDVLMFPINLAADAMPGRRTLLDVCAAKGVGLVAMKPYAGGRLLRNQESISVDPLLIGQTHSELKHLRLEKSVSITPVQCLSYILSQTSVSVAIPGVKDVPELEAAFKFLDATEQEKDFSSVVNYFRQYLAGKCVYCNHCLPCPAGIDVGQTVRLLEAAQGGITEQLQTEYDALAAKPSACAECGACLERCPFEVGVITKMRQAAALFEANG